MHNQIDLTQGSVARHVWRMTPPMAVAFFAMMAFNLADTWFVSRLGTEPLAAMGFTFPIVMIIFSIAMGIGIGVSSCVSRAIGAQDQHRVKHLTTYSLLLTFLVMSILTVVGFPLLPKLLVVLGAKGQPLELATTYLLTWLIFVPLGALPMVGNNAIRATGDTLRPGIIMSVAAIVNVVLDPIFIFGWGPVPAMGVRGAALATGLSRLVTLAWSLWLLHFRCHLLTTKWTGWRDLFSAWGSVLHIALPSAATNMLMPLSMGVVTKFIAGYGAAAVAATAAGQRIEQFTYLLPMAMGSTLVPIIGQNWGAGRIDRVREVWVTTNWYGVAYGVLCLLLAVPLARPLAGWFSTDPYITHLIARYLLIVLSGSILLHAAVHTGFAFNAIRRPFNASGLLIIRSAVLIIPLTWLGGHWFGLLGVYAGMGISSGLSGLIAMLWFSRVIRREVALPPPKQRVGTLQRPPKWFEPSKQAF